MLPPATPAPDALITIVVIGIVVVEGEGIIGIVSIPLAGLLRRLR